MSHLSKGRYALRTAAVSAVAIASLAGASSANAALGGGTPPSLTDIPNLVSVTTTNTAVIFTYDRTIDCVTTATCDPGNWSIGGYSAGDAITGTAATVSGNAVRVTFGGTLPDTDSFTFGAVADNTVHTQGTLGANNLRDATRITGAEGESGTRGHTVGPDLVSAVATGGGSNYITATFDQDVDPASVTGTGYHIVKADGSIANGVAGTEQVDDNVVEVEFANADPVAGAKALYVDGTAGNSTDTGHPAPIQSVQIGTQNQTSVAPQLKSAELTSSDTVVYTFDKKVSTPNNALFAVQDADDGAPVPSNSATVIGDGTQVQAQFPTDQYSEYLVQASVDAGAVVSLSGAVPSVIGGKPIGGNAGAKATGFTTAPDVVGATYSGPSVVVTADSRIVPAYTAAAAANFLLLGDDGTTIAAATTATPQASGVPGPSRVNLLYTTDAVEQAEGILVDANSLQSTSAAAFTNPAQQLGR